MASNEKKKIGLSNYDCLLEDFDNNPKAFTCNLCNIQCTDLKAKEKHIGGKNHAKKLQEVKVKSECRIKYEESESENSADDEIYCDICHKEFDRFVSYASHVKGRTHAKNLKKQKLKNELDYMPEVIKKEKEEKDSSEDDTLETPYAKCKYCKKDFFGPESFKQHLRSSTHLKKVKQAKMMEALKQDEAKNAEDEDICSKCEICDTNFSGVIPYQTHMRSNKHKKNLERKKIAEEIKDFYTKTDEGYACKECKKVFSDPMALKLHLHSNSHEKQKAKAELKEFLNDHPEIAFTTPYDKVASEDENDSDESDPTYFLICKLCNFSFNGPESAEAHVKSKKHISLLKEKEARRLLKEKKNISCKIFDNTTDEKQPPVKAPSEHKNMNAFKHDMNTSDEEFEEL